MCRWKKWHTEAAAELEHLRALLAERNTTITALEGRLGPIEIDLAIMSADRGRCVFACSCVCVSVCGGSLLLQLHMALGEWCWLVSRPQQVGGGSSLKGCCATGGV